MASVSSTRRQLLKSFAAAVVGLAIAGPAAYSWADEPLCGRVYLVNTQNELLRLRRTAQLLELLDDRSTNANRMIQIRERMPISGMAAGETFIGIDFRPATGVLYGVGRIGTDAVGQLYTVDFTSAVATPVGARTIPLVGSGFGVDFNPVPDLLRIVSDTGQNMRIRPGDGTVAGTDTPLAYPAAGDPNATRTARVVAVAYTNPDVESPTTQTNTVLHDIDVNRAADPDRAGDVLAIQVPPNGGVLNTVGSLRLDADDLTSFDIGPDNEALAAIRPTGSQFSSLYFIDLPSGAATKLGRIGKGEQVVGLAIMLGPQCFATP